MPSRLHFYGTCLLPRKQPDTIAGREALVEGATSTAQSGYSMRLGVKALESTVSEYDTQIPFFFRLKKRKLAPIQ